MEGVAIITGAGASLQWAGLMKISLFPLTQISLFPLEAVFRDIWAVKNDDGGCHGSALMILLAVDLPWYVSYDCSPQRADITVEPVLSNHLVEQNILSQGSWSIMHEVVSPD